ncbi:uracil-DNA glycosylase [Nocardioidaceae bacterium]|nr:uracil-DNA glycosylase [Nocardioidaceae bacterium]
MTAPGSLDSLVERGLMAADWAEALAPVGPDIARMGDFLRAEVAAGRGYQPAGELVLRAFERPLAGVRVLLVGQDPYPTPGVPVGLSFSAARGTPVPASLRNIYTELSDDLGVAPAPHGDLTAWADRGVLLLNRVLTVRPGEANSHRGKGWEAVTECAIDALAARGGPLVGLLWGNPARSLRARLGDVPCVESPHPSPLSAHRGFFGSRPFSQVNAALEAQGADAIEWRVV